MSRDINPFALRIPADLKKDLEKEAKEIGRSLNAESVKRLRNSLALGIEEPEQKYRSGKSSQTLQDAIILGEALLKETGKPMVPKEKARFIDTLYDLLAMYGDAEIVKEKIANVINMEDYLKNETG